MALITLTTDIKAPSDVCFDLSRSVDLHLTSMRDSGERAVAGKLHGHLQTGEQVTWEARHFGLKFRMTVKISEMEQPGYFIDEMVHGPFKMLRHLHSFAQRGEVTRMTDEFIFRSPLGFIGKVVDKFILAPYLRRLLEKRNAAIKNAAELHEKFRTSRPAYGLTMKRSSV